MATDRRVFSRVAVLGLAATLFASAAPAQQTGTESTDTLPAGIGRAYDVALSRISQELSRQQLSMLQTIAHATAAASLCPTLSLNESVIYGALAAATHDAADPMTLEEQEQHRDYLMIAYGAISALRLVEAIEDEAGFCAAAVEHASDPEEIRFLMVAAAPEPVPEATPAPEAAPAAPAN